MLHPAKNDWNATDRLAEILAGISGFQSEINRLWAIEAMAHGALATRGQQTAGWSSALASRPILG